MVLFKSGDFYGHAGMIQESYDSYLKTLAIDPNIPML
jgi:hypothetical protein